MEVGNAIKRIIRKCYLIFGLFSIHFLVQGQVNQWIDYDRDYYKIPTASDGVFRLSYTTLSASGIPVESIDPREIRVFHRGREVAVTIQGEADGRFDQEDFLEFIGRRNDARLDEGLYDNPDWIPNPYYNTYNDTTAFFLTISPGERGSRMGTISLQSDMEEAISYQKSALMHYSEQYAMGRVYFPGVRLSVYDQGQGWTSSILSRGASRSIAFTNLGTVVDKGTPRLQLSLVGRSETPHLSAIKVGPSVNELRELGQYRYDNFQSKIIEEDLRVTDFSADGNLFVSIASLGENNAVDNISINYARVSYQAAVSPGDFDNEVFGYEQGGKKIPITGVNENYVAYEIEDIYNPIKLELAQRGGVLEFPAGISGKPGKVLVQNERQVIEPNVLKKVRFRNFSEQNANFLIISHELLKRPAANYGDPVSAYASYRATPAGVVLIP